MKDILDKYSGIPFEWGKLDCCEFFAKVIGEYKGLSYPWDISRGTYSTEEEANEIIGHDIEKFVTTNVGVVPSTDWKQIKVGFPVMLNLNNKKLIGINFGARSYFVTEQGRYLKVPNRICQCYWRVF